MTLLRRLRSQRVEGQIARTSADVVCKRSLNLFGGGPGVEPRKRLAGPPFWAIAETFSTPSLPHQNEPSTDSASLSPLWKTGVLDQGTLPVRTARQLHVG